MILSIPWIEKYRPIEIEDLILDKQVEQQIKIFLQDRKNVHLIITGVPGIGKTSAAKCIAKRILKENISEGFLELNAAEDRGTRSISAIIPPFCRKMVNFTTSKIILLDEADNITPKCQNDISNMIKIYGQKTKFIFTCNESSKIIEDIQSICRIIKFKKLTNEQISEYLVKICKKEGVEYNMQGIATICYISNGDMRKAINNLQLVAYTYGIIKKENVLKICKVPDPKDIEKVIDLCSEKKLNEAIKRVNEIISQGYYCIDIVNTFIYVLTNYKMKEFVKLQLIDIVNQTKIIVSCGLCSKLQLAGMISRIISIIHSKN